MIYVSCSSDSCATVLQQDTHRTIDTHSFAVSSDKQLRFAEKAYFITQGVQKHILKDIRSCSWIYGFNVPLAEVTKVS